LPVALPIPTRETGVERVGSVLGD